MTTTILATTILALDLGTTTGWALRNRDGSVVSGSENFRPRRFEGGGMRYLRFGRWLDELKAGGIDEVHFEEVRRHAGVDAAHAYGGFPLPRSAPGVSTTAFRIKACRWARSRSTPPAKATRARTK